MIGNTADTDQRSEAMEKTIHSVLKRTDWALLAEQKRMLLEIDGNDAVAGIVNFLDALQDAAEAEGFHDEWIRATA